MNMTCELGRHANDRWPVSFSIITKAVPSPSPTATPTASASWLDSHASAIQAASAAIQAMAAWVTIALTVVLVGATLAYVLYTNRLAARTGESVQATRDLLADQQNARTQDHVSAVEAVYQELVAIARPLRLILEHGELGIRVPFATVAAYREVLGPLYRGLPPAVGEQLAKTYSLLDIQRRALDAMNLNVHQLNLVFNEDLIPTIDALRTHLHELARDLPPPPEPIAAADIHLTQQMVQHAKQQGLGAN